MSPRTRCAGLPARSGLTRSGPFRFGLHRPALIGCVLVLSLVTACSASSGTKPLPSPEPTGTAHPLVIAVTLAGGTVAPHDKTYDVPTGTTVDLRLTSDHATVVDVLPGPEFPVGANQTVPATFVLHTAGTYRVRATKPNVLIATLTVS